MPVGASNMHPKWLLVVSLLVAGCAHSIAIDLRRALALEMTTGPNTVIAGQELTATFRVRNVSQYRLKLCSAGGVSMLLRFNPASRIWPLEQHGITMDTACSGPITLRPDEAVTFVEHGVVRRDWPAGESVLLASYTVWCDGNVSCDTATIDSRMPLTVTATPN
jgi:hypothetical protein